MANELEKQGGEPESGMDNLCDYAEPAPTCLLSLTRPHKTLNEEDGQRKEPYSLETQPKEAGDASGSSSRRLTASLAILAAMFLVGIGAGSWFLKKPRVAAGPTREEALAVALRQPGTQGVAVLADMFATNRSATTPAPLMESLLINLQHPGAGRPMMMDNVQSVAQVRLVELGPEAKGAIPTLIPLLQDPDKLTRLLPKLDVARWRRCRS